MLAPIASTAHACDAGSVSLFRERPRFYIFELKDHVPCDPETPVGTAYVK